MFYICGFINSAATISLKTLSQMPLGIIPRRGKTLGIIPQRGKTLGIIPQREKTLGIILQHDDTQYQVSLC